MSTLSDTPRVTAAQSTAAPSAAPAAGSSVTTDSRLRVMLLLEVRGGAERRFLRAYDQLRHQVAAVPGHLSDQLCQSIEDPSKWLITSEWESSAPFLAWVDSEEHREMVRPMRACVEDMRSLRFTVLRETPDPETAGPPDPETAGPPGPKTAGRSGRPARGRLQTEPRIGDGLVRHALTFTVRPGSEERVAEILAGYAPPKAQVDETTRLHRTSLFMRGNRVVRAVEIEGDLTTALRHVARQPEIRAVEEAINPYLEVDRDLDDPASAGAFFQRAALPAVHHLAPAGAAEPPLGAPVRRHALIYPVRRGCGAAVARLLARQDALAAQRPGQPLLRATVFQHDDTVVRLIDLSEPVDRQPAVTAGISGRRAAAVMSRLVQLPRSVDLSTPAGLRLFLAGCAMRPVTDRRAADS